jgi:hypothetical protein
MEILKMKSSRNQIFIAQESFLRRQNQIEERIIDTENRIKEPLH